jgi:two-component system nitrogen regulation sensor histidine kinase GlnL
MNLTDTLIPSLTEAVFVFEADGKLAAANPSAERVTGRSEKSMLGQGAVDLFPEGDLPDLLTTVLNEGRSVMQSGIEITNPSGQVFYLSVSISPLVEPDGTVVGAALMARDETLFREIDRSHRRADQIATLETLNLGMAHEIKNPLGGIKGATQLLRLEIGDDSELAEHCDIILREVNRIDGLLESLLSAMPRETTSYEEINIHELLDGVIQLLELSEETSGQTYNRLYDPSLPPIPGDRNRLTQVFLNILKNAAEASGEGAEIVIRTSTPMGSPGGPVPVLKGGTLEVTVKDSGPGFDENMEDFVKPFFTTKPKGVGLGLAISEQIIQNHGGSLLLGNREDGGAVVRVYLPISPEG